MDPVVYDLLMRGMLAMSAGARLCSARELQETHRLERY